MKVLYGEGSRTRPRAVRSRSRGRRRSVGRGRHRPAIEPRKNPYPGRRRRPSVGRRCGPSRTKARGRPGPARSETLACAQAPCAGTERSPVHPGRLRRRIASGRRGAVAGDERAGEVTLRHSSWEADERSRATGRGAGGAKGGGQGKCEPAKHAPGAALAKRVTGAGAHTESGNIRFAVTYPRQEPDALIGPVRICAGGVQQWTSLPR